MIFLNYHHFQTVRPFLSFYTLTHSLDNVAISMILSIQVVLFNKVPVTLYSVIDLYGSTTHFVRTYSIKREKENIF